MVQELIRLWWNMGSLKQGTSATGRGPGRSLEMEAEGLYSSLFSLLTLREGSV